MSDSLHFLRFKILKTSKNIFFKYQIFFQCIFSIILCLVLYVFQHYVVLLCAFSYLTLTFRDLYFILFLLFDYLKIFTTFLLLLRPTRSTLMFIELNVIDCECVLNSYLHLYDCLLQKAFQNSLETKQKKFNVTDNILVYLFCYYNIYM